MDRIFLAIVALVAMALIVIVATLPTPHLAFRRAAGVGDVLILSGKIEAHESVLSFRTVQSRIVDLPFNEGQRVRKGAVLAIVDAADYRQQMAKRPKSVALLILRDGERIYVPVELG